MRNFTIYLLVYLLGACTIDSGPPKQGPEGSWWLGGADGGAFVNIKEDANPDDRIYAGTIYFDSDMTVWYSGPFRLVGDIEFLPDNHELYIYWDGERLHLENNSYLEAVNPIPQL